MDNRFEGVYKPAIGVDFATRTVQIDERGVRIQVWDTGTLPCIFIVLVYVAVYSWTGAVPLDSVCVCVRFGRCLGY